MYIIQFGNNAFLGHNLSLWKHHISLLNVVIWLFHYGEGEKDGRGHLFDDIYYYDNEIHLENH